MSPGSGGRIIGQVRIPRRPGEVLGAGSRPTAESTLAGSAREVVVKPRSGHLKW